MSQKFKVLNLWLFLDYLFEDKPLVNKFISVPKDQSMWI